MTLKRFFIIFACITTFSCSEPGPDLDHIHQALSRYIESSEYFKLSEISLSETKMVSEDTYSLKITYQLIAKQNLDIVVEQNLANSLNTEFDLLMATSAYKMHYGNFESGDIIPKADSILLVKHGETWRVNR